VGIIETPCLISWNICPHFTTFMVIYFFIISRHVKIRRGKKVITPLFLMCLHYLFYSYTWISCFIVRCRFMFVIETIHLILVSIVTNTTFITDNWYGNNILFYPNFITNLWNLFKTFFHLFNFFNFFKLATYNIKREACKRYVYIL
jgi:hypothetical protein